MKKDNKDYIDYLFEKVMTFFCVASIVVIISILFATPGMFVEAKEKEETCKEHVHEVKDIQTEIIKGCSLGPSSHLFWKKDTFDGWALFLVDGIPDSDDVATVMYRVKSIDEYREITEHLYEQFDIAIDSIEYTDGCSTKQSRLIGLSEK